MLNMHNSAVRDAILEGDSQRLRKLVLKYSHFDQESSENEHFPDDVMEFILDMMNTEELQSMVGSYELLRLFDYKWDELNEAQKNKLLHAIERLYERFNDPMAHFVMSELLGNRFSDRVAFNVLCRLAKCKKEIARAHIPMGFEDIVRESREEELQKMAYQKLMEFRDDPSETVRDEVVESLRRLKTTLVPGHGH